MPDNDLHSIWSVLQTEASGPEAAIEAVPSGIQIKAGEVLLGVDNNGRRILLVPLRPGEAFAEDKSGRAIRLLRVKYENTTYLAAVSLREDLDSVFTQFVSELLTEISEAASPAAATVAALSRWRLLFSYGEPAGFLSDQALIGLLAELLTLRQLMAADEQRRLTFWLGPSGFQHDFRSGSLSIEVKGTLAREGRIIPISSVFQLEEPPGGELFLYHYRFEQDSTGLTLPQLVGEILDMGVEQDKFKELLGEAGYRMERSEDYRYRAFRIAECRMYAVDGDTFPRIIPASFNGNVVPAGTTRITYSIDLTNEPPSPMSADDAEHVVRRMTE